MKIVALMLVRDEEWVINLSAHVAGLWCDAIVAIAHNCTDRTVSAICDSTSKPKLIRTVNQDPWNEMDLRQDLLNRGREIGGTHWALIDADEVLTANLIPEIRKWGEIMEPGDIIDLPMIPVWGDLTKYRDDDSVWSKAWLSTLVRDSSDLCWKPKEDGYHFHNRVPYGKTRRIVPISHKANGGVMHLQFACNRRLRAKHAWYKMQEVVRWPDRSSPGEIDKKYNQALNEQGIRFSPVKKEWIEGYNLLRVNLNHTPWHEKECTRLWQEHGREKFEGLELWGIPNAESHRSTRGTITTS